MVVHLNEFFPGHCKVLGEEKMRKAIQYGIERSRTYGIISERDVCKYIDFMFVFEPNFDTELSWANEILIDETIENPGEKIERLYNAVPKHEDHAKGISNSDWR